MNSPILLILLAAVIGCAGCFTVRRFRKGGGCCGEHEKTEARTAVKDRNRAHYPYAVSLQIGGMTCENCARRVENALNALDGVWANVSISDHRAALRLKQPPSEAALRDAVSRAGYVVMEYQTVK